MSHKVGVEHQPAGWWQLKDFLIFIPSFREDEPNFDEHMFHLG